LPGQAGGFCGWSMMKKTKAGSWSTGVSSIVFVFVGIAAVVTICPGVAAVVAVDNFLTDGTVAPTVVPPRGVVGLQDCDAFFGITTPDDCTAACGRFLLNFQLYTVDWVAVEEVDGENQIPDNNNNNNSVGVDDNDAVITNDDENLILSSAAAATAYIDARKFDANARTNGLTRRYAGFICQCPNHPNQSINCVYTYDFPACQAVGVVDCSDTDLIVSNTKDPPPPPISVTLAPAVAPGPPSSLSPAENDGYLSQTLNDTAMDESTFNNNTNATITNSTERFRYKWRRRTMLSQRKLQGFDDESDVFLDGMFNATEGPPGTNHDGSGSNSSILGPILGDRNNVTSLISEDDIVNNYGNNNNTANATSIQNDTNSTSASNSNSSSSSHPNSTPISCASFCHSLGMDVGAKGAGQTSKNNINNKATRTICAANPGDDNDIDDVNSNSTVISSWVACACQVRSAFSNDGSNNVYVTEGFYVCGDEGFNKTGIVLGSSGSVGGHHIRRNNILGWIGLFGLLLIHTTIHVLY